MGIKRVFATSITTGGGGTGDLTLTTGGFAARSDLNAQNLTASASGGTAGYTFAWTCVRPDGSASTSEFSSASAQNPTFTPVRVGLYAVTCTVTDSTSGSALTAASTQSKTVGTVLSAAISGLANSATLAAQALTATPAGGTGSPTYAWTCTRPDNSSSTSEFSSTTVNNPNFTPASSGLHKVQCVVTDSSSVTATAIATADVGTGGVAVGSRTQITSLSGWTQVDGPNTQAVWAGGASIVPNAGVFTFADSAHPTTALNQPQEMRLYYSTAAELSAVDFTGTPGVLTLRMEAQGSNSLAAAKQYILFGIVDSAYSGSSTSDWAYGFVTNEIVSGKSSGGVCLGNDASSVTNTSQANNNGQEILDCVIYINIDGDPDENLGNFFEGTTKQVRVLQSNIQTAFSASNDARLVLGIGRAHNGAAGACSSTWKFYWSYSKIGA
jgi:hypothetical protein